MDSYQDIYSNICRVCLSIQNKETMVCLTDNLSEDGLSCFGKSVKTFATISLSKTDKLPIKMCQKCLILLKQAIYFKFKCESSDKQLIHWTKLSENINNSEEKLKEVIVENIMFTQYFPEDSSCKSPMEVNDTQSTNIIDIDKSNSVCNDYDNGFQDDDNARQSQDTLEVDSADEILNTMEKMIGQYPKLINIQKGYIPKRLNYENNIPVVKLKQSVSLSQIHNLSRNQTKTVAVKYICNICNKDLANLNTYNHHMQRHNGYKYICEHCGKGFPVLAEMQLHQVVRHGTGPYLQCHYCNFKAPRKYNLIEHVRIHTGERPYTCDKCGLTFRRRAIWRKHMIYHTEKTIQCMHCPRKFYRRSEMLAHANNMHERIYVYLCHKCDITYAKPATVRRHLTERHGIPKEMQGKILRINKGRAAVLQRNNFD